MARVSQSGAMSSRSKVFDTSQAIFDELTATGAEVVINDVFPIDRDGPLDDRSVVRHQDEAATATTAKCWSSTGRSAGSVVPVSRTISTGAATTTSMRV